MRKNIYFLPLIPSQRFYYVARESVNGNRVMPNSCDGSVGLKLNGCLGVSIQSKIHQNERLVILQSRPKKKIKHKAWIKTLTPVLFKPKAVCLAVSLNCADGCSPALWECTSTQGKYL